MPLPDGGDIQLGPYRFNVDRTVGASNSLVRPHGSHLANSLVAGRVDISGKPGAQNLDPELLLWTYDDWSGGEGNLVYDPSRPFVYDYGTINPRNAGYVTSAPERTNSNISTSVSPAKVFLVNSAGALWALGGTGATAFAKYTTDGENWTPATITVTTGYTIAACAAGGNYIYFWASDQPPGTYGASESWRISATTNDAFTDPAGFSLAPIGMAYQGPFLFGWNGVRMGIYDTTQDLPVGGSEVFSSGLQDFPSTFYGGMSAGDNAVYLFYSATGTDASVWSFQGGPSGFASPIWGGPGGGLNGFTARCMTFSAGVLYLAGTYGGRAQLRGLDMQTNIPIDIGYFRKDLNTDMTPVSLTQGHGSTVLIGMAEGYVFVYDPEADGLSELDERTNFTALQALSTYKNHRVAVWRDSGDTTVRASSWGLDDSTRDETSNPYYFVTPVWDFDLPMEASKLAIDCHVITSELTNDVTCKVEYQTEEDGTWVDIGTKHNGTHHVYTASSESTYVTADGGMTNVTTNNSVIFTQIRFRVTIKGGPKVYRFTARAFDTGYVETWQFTLALDDDNPGGGTSAFMARAYQKRDWLWEQKQAHAILPFLDGMRYPELSPTNSGNPRAYSSHSVVIEDLEDIYENVEQKASGEGIMRITLRTLTAN